MGNGSPQRRQFASILERAFDHEPAKSDPLFDGFLDEHENPSDVWFDALLGVMDMFPGELDAHIRQRRIRWKVDKLYQRGEIQGIGTIGHRTYHVFACSDGGMPPAGCSCEASRGEFPCVHGLEFLDYVTDELEDSSSRLSNRINRGQFDQGDPDRTRFKLDVYAHTMATLDDLIKAQRGLQADDVPDDALPEIQSCVEQRVVWNFDFEDGQLSVDALLQQRKKRGDGFTKGKKLSLEKVCTDFGLPLSPVDKQIVTHITSESSYYYGRKSYSLDLFGALGELVGQSNVMLGGEPCDVRRRPLVLTLAKTATEDCWRFRLTDELGDSNIGVVVAGHDTTVAVDRERRRLVLSKTTEQRVQLARQLLSLGAFKDDQLADVVKKVRPLQKRITLRLPAEHGGQLLVEDAPLAILLRSRSDGSLDFGVRVRDSAGALRQPGADPTIVTAERDGKTVQLQRLAASEYQRAKKLIDQLGVKLSEEQWFGSITGFHIGLALIEKLQTGDLDVEVLWDKSSEKPVSVLGNLTSKNVRVDITSKRNWFGVTGECDFGKQKLPLADLLAGMGAATVDDMQGDYLRVGDGQWARISEKLRARLKRLQDATHQDRKTLKLDATGAPAIRDLLESDVEVKATKAWQKCLDRLQRAEKLDPIVPDSLDATLRDYQVDGFKWLRRLAEWGVGGILADDMGLGKTLQALAVLLDRSAEGPALVIAPTSVGFNWGREAERFAPDLDVHLYRETEREDFLPSVGPGSLVICSYGLALRDAEALAQVQWSTVVLDEAQAIKNSRSKTSKAIAGLNADWTVALTGTPVENHLGELWSLFHVVSPGVFGGWDQFRKRYAAPIEKHNDDESRHCLAERLQPFVLRRTKSEVLTELPPRTEMNLYVDLSPAERGEYEKVRLAALGEVELIESLPTIQDQRFKILALLTRLRQISCHAGLVNKNWTESSAKLDELCRTLESLREEGHRALVFSQFTQHLALIRKQLDQQGFTYEYLDGSTAAKARQQAVDRFQSGTADAFLISLKAGGTGLNLTAADYVIHMDPWWNPAVEDQATDRAHRIGQDKPVLVYRIIAKDTIEEEILALHESKRDLVAGVMQGTEAAAKLTNEDLIRMLRA